MRNYHSFKSKVDCRCPKCGEEFVKTVVAEYVTNQRGDVIESIIKKVRTGK